MLIPTFYPNRMGGSELQAMKLSKQLIANGHEVTVLTVKTKGLSDFENVEGIKVYRVTSPLLLLPRLILFIQNRISFLRKKIKQSVIEEYGKPNGISELIISRVLYNAFRKTIVANKLSFSVIQINTVEWLSITGTLLAKKFSRPLLIKDSTANGLAKMKFMSGAGKYRNWIAGNASFVAISSVIKKNLISEGVQEKRIYSINNGIEISDLTRSEDAAALNSCLFVGNLYQEPAKGFSILLKAWQKVVSEINTAVLNVVGDGDIPFYESKVEAMGLRDNVKFWGKQKDVQRFYLSNEIFVLPSIREGMSNSLMEAMNFGLPCISTIVSGSTDLIIDGESGILVKAGDDVELSQRLIYLLSNKNLHASLGNKAKERIKMLCDFDIVSNKYVMVYKAISAA